uniref:Uncharacterized protein n=1 Tax=Salix viminalis TaxID=40686 RepID=A0A6N2M9E6_SALVM
MIKRLTDPKFLLQKMNPEAENYSDPKKSVLPMDYCTSTPFSQEGAGSDRCRQDDGENTLYQKLSCRNILVDKEQQSIPCTPRKAQACFHIKNIGASKHNQPS